MSDCQNLGPNEIKKRRIVGTVGLVSYFGTLYYFATHQVPTLYQFLIFVPYLITIVGFYQAEEKTCLAIAVQGKENYDNGNKHVANDEKRKSLIDKGKHMIKRTLISSSLLTLITVFYFSVLN